MIWCGRALLQRPPAFVPSGGNRRNPVEHGKTSPLALRAFPAVPQCRAREGYIESERWSTMRILFCPASFKGSLSAGEAALAMERGALRVWPDARTECVPVADGGEGTVDALVAATRGSIFRVTVTGPLSEPVDAFYGVLGDGTTAVIEMAAAAGLPLVPPQRRDPRHTTTHGVGELIRSALDRGCSRIIIGLGGSATNDGGAGMAQALGARLLDAGGAEIGRGGAALPNLARIETDGIDSRIAATEFIAACDVTNPLTGPSGASAVYGPQKGATPGMVRELDAALRHFGRVLSTAVGRELVEVPGSGAAGGLGAGVLGFLGARFQSGIDMVIQASALRSRMDGADLVLIGEGRLDDQTVQGKAPSGVAKLANELGIPVLAIGGSLAPESKVLYSQGVAGMMATASGPVSLEEAMARAGEMLADAAERMLRIYRAGLERGRQYPEGLRPRGAES